MKKCGVSSEELILSRLRQVSKYASVLRCSNTSATRNRRTAAQTRNPSRVNYTCEVVEKSLCFCKQASFGKVLRGNFKNSVMRNLADCVIYQSDPSPLRGRKQDEAMIFHLFLNLFMRVCLRKEESKSDIARERSDVKVQYEVSDSFRKSIHSFKRSMKSKMRLAVNFEEDKMIRINISQ